ncbi:dihydrofolate reductase [Aureimonas ureilytica]|uniref:Dihydrofolate reductase n=1 Tax=Aureimonas ureilytica TaxID=401562 RepID=A0A175R8L2_9HYPH|nr:2-hydroxyacid dehydrogenase [Aureimonas ureilytica]KTQ95899.1 dihydrofolate reductase [Aureimonas ureilytica]
MTANILQLCPLMPALEKALAERFTVHRFFEAADPDAFLAEHAERLRGVVTGGHIGIPAELAARLPALEIVAINGVGFDKVDLTEAKRRGVRVSNTPDVLTEDVADLAIGLIVSALRQIPRGHEHVRAGRWPSGDLPLGSKVSRRRYGIFGFGRIGQAIARRLEGFDAEIAYASRSAVKTAYPRFDTVADLAGWADVLVVAASASPETRNMIDAQVLDALGPKGVLVNVARGSLVDEPALLDALEQGRIAGAALDVFADEPRVPERFFTLSNVVLTPHMASATHETRQAMADLVLANLDAHFAGREMPTALV